MQCCDISELMLQITILQEISKNWLFFFFPTEFGMKLHVGVWEHAMGWRLLSHVALTLQAEEFIVLRLIFLLFSFYSFHNPSSWGLGGFFWCGVFWGLSTLFFPTEEGWLSLSYKKMNGRLVATDIEIAMNYSSKGLTEFSCSEKGTSPAARQEGGTLRAGLPAQTVQPHQPPPQRGRSRGQASHQPQQRLWGDTAGDGRCLQAGHGGYAPDAFWGRQRYFQRPDIHYLYVCGLYQPPSLWSS